MIDQINRCLMEANNNYDLNMMKINAVSEAAEREYKINCTAAELKVVQENGTSDDLNYLLEEASNGMLERVLATLKKIRDAIIKFFRDIKDKVISIFTKSENVETVEKIEKKIKFFPLLGKKKIKIIDKNAIDKNADEHMSKLSRLMAKIKGKQHVDSDEIEEIEDSFYSKHRKLIAVSTVVISVVAALGLYKKFAHKSKDDINSQSNDVVSKIDDAADVAESIAEENGDPDAIANIQSMSKSLSNISKEKVSSDVSFMHSLLSEIKGAITSVKSGFKGGNTEVETESSLYENPYYGYDLFEDSSDGGTDFGSEGPDDESNNSDNNVSEYGDDLDLDDNIDIWDNSQLDDPSDLNDAFESAYSDLYNDIIADPCECGYPDKPNNDSIVSSLYDQINSLGSTGRRNLNESTFESLMSDIDRLEFL